MKESVPEKEKYFMAYVGRSYKRVEKSLVACESRYAKLLYSSREEWKNFTQKSIDKIREEIEPTNIHFLESGPVDQIDTLDLLKKAVEFINEFGPLGESEFYFDVTALPRHIAIEFASFIVTQYPNTHIVVTPVESKIEKFGGEERLWKIAEEPGLDSVEIEGYRAGIRKALFEISGKENFEEEMKTVLLELNRVSDWISQLDLYTNVKSLIEISGRSSRAKRTRLARVTNSLEDLNLVRSYTKSGERYTQITDQGRKIINIYFSNKKA